MSDDPIWTDAECNRYIVEFFFNGLALGVFLGATTCAVILACFPR